MNASKEVLFLPLVLEQQLFRAQRVLFTISCILHVPALFCLLRQTPPHQSQIKPILVLLQILIIIVDVIDTYLCETVVLPEALAAYSKGPLLDVLAPTTTFCVFMFGINAIGVVLFACILWRHQTTMPAGNRFKLGKKSRRCLIAAVTIVFFAPIIIFAAFPISQEESDRLINESHYDIAWIRERGVAFKLPDNEVMNALLPAAIVGLIGSFVYTMIPFFHMFYVLGRDTSKSEQTTILIRQSLRRLFVQLNVPFLFVTGPLIVICIQADHRCFPFMVGVLACFTLPLHPIVHNLVLLSLTPSYRKALIKYSMSLRDGRKSTVNTVQLAPIPERKVSTPLSMI